MLDIDSGYELAIFFMSLMFLLLVAPVLITMLIGFSVLIYRRIVHKNEIPFSRFIRALVFSTLFQIVFYYAATYFYVFVFNKGSFFFVYDPIPIMIFFSSPLAGVVFSLYAFGTYRVFEKNDLNKGLQNDGSPAASRA